MLWGREQRWSRGKFDLQHAAQRFPLSPEGYLALDSACEPPHCLFASSPRLTGDAGGIIFPGPGPGSLCQAEQRPPLGAATHGSPVWGAAPCTSVRAQSGEAGSERDGAGGSGVRHSDLPRERSGAWPRASSQGGGDDSSSPGELGCYGRTQGARWPLFTPSPTPGPRCSSGTATEASRESHRGRRDVSKSARVARPDESGSCTFGEAGSLGDEQRGQWEGIRSTGSCTVPSADDQSAPNRRPRLAGSNNFRRSDGRGIGASARSLGAHLVWEKDVFTGLAHGASAHGECSAARKEQELAVLLSPPWALLGRRLAEKETSDGLEAEPTDVSFALPDDLLLGVGTSMDNGTGTYELESFGEDQLVQSPWCVAGSGPCSDTAQIIAGRELLVGCGARSYPDASLHPSELMRGSAGFGWVRSPELQETETHRSADESLKDASERCGPPKVPGGALWEYIRVPVPLSIRGLGTPPGDDMIHSVVDEDGSQWCAKKCSSTPLESRVEDRSRAESSMMLSAVQSPIGYGEDVFDLRQCSGPTEGASGFDESPVEDVSGDSRDSSCFVHGPVFFRTLSAPLPLPPRAGQSPALRVSTVG